MFGTANPLNIERVIGESHPDEGYRSSVDWSLPPIVNWSGASGAPLATGSGDARIAVHVGVPAVRWVPTADESDTITAVTRVPLEYNARSNDLVMTIDAVKHGSTTDENTDLALAVSLTQITHVANGASTSESVSATVVVPFDASSADRYSTLSVNLGAAFAAAGKTLTPGATVVIALGPNELVGAASSPAMSLYVTNPCLTFRRHANLANRDLRNR